MYRNPSVMVAVTDNFVPASTTFTTDASSFASARIFSSVVAYLLPITLSFGVSRGEMVSEADVLGLDVLTGVLAVPRLSSCFRAVVSSEDDSSEAVEAGAG